MELIGGIWYKGEDQDDKLRAINLLNTIVETYREDNININYHNNLMGRMALEFDNGDFWEVVPSDTTRRGCYFNITCVSKEIQNEWEEARVMGAAHPMYMPDTNTYIICKF